MTPEQRALLKSVGIEPLDEVHNQPFVPTFVSPDPFPCLFKPLPTEFDTDEVERAVQDLLLTGTLRGKP